MAVKTCTRCGEDNNESAQACVVCGESLRDSKTVGVKDTDKDYSNLHFEDETKCRICGSEQVEEGYQLNLCKDCREKLIKRKIPFLMKVAAVLVIILICFSFSRLPESIKSGIIYNDGIEAYQAKEYNKALSDFGKLSKFYPNSNELAGWIGLTYFETGEYEKAVIEFEKIPDEGVMLSSELEHEMEIFVSKFNGGSEPE